MPKKKTETKKTDKITGTVFGGGLNIREQPGIESAIKGVLEDGSRIEILENTGDWLKIETGYVMAKWVKLDG